MLPSSLFPSTLKLTTMATSTDTRVDPQSGFDYQTRTYQSLRPKVPLPPITQPLSITQFSISLLLSSSPTSASFSSIPVLVDSPTGCHLSYSLFLSRIRSLSSSLYAAGLRRGQTAFILSPSSPLVPVVFLSLMSLGVVVAPANPLGSESEIRHQVSITRPDVAFATLGASSKLPDSIPRVIVLDSPEFSDTINLSLPKNDGKNDVVFVNEEVRQSDPAAILFSSGTTGRVKGVMLTHRNLISGIAGLHAHRRAEIEANNAGKRQPNAVSLMFLPMFHVFGFFMMVRAVGLGETVVVMERFDFEAMLRAVERYRVTFMPAPPPLVVAMVKSELVGKYDLSSLTLVLCGGSPLGVELVKRFRAKFPNVEISQGYGLTEAGSVTRPIRDEPSNNNVVTTVGKLAENMEAKIVDPVSGEALPPGHRGELWLRGSFVMKGYVGDAKATAETLDSEGWFKTGDLCMFDSQGYLYIVDRLKELIKYNAYSVPPAELEHVLQSHPEIVDAAVVPYPDEDAGEIPMAYVVRKSGSNLSAAQVMDFVAKKVSPYKKIRRVAFINAIPKSPVGKILRRELVNHALSTEKSKL